VQKHPDLTPIGAGHGAPLSASWRANATYRRTLSVTYDSLPGSNKYLTYNKNVFAVNGQEYTMSAYHVLWPIPQKAIDSNTQGVINQNFGYDGIDNNVAPQT